MQTSRPQGAKPSWTLAPWFDSDWPVLCRECRKLERRYRRTERKVDHAAFFAALCNKHAKFATKQNQYWSEWTSADAGCSAKLWRSPSKILRRDDNSQGSHYLLILKFNDFSRTFKDPQISFSRTNSRRKFTAWAVEQQYLMFMYVMMVQLLRNKTWYYLANVDSGNIRGRLHMWQTESPRRQETWRQQCSVTNYLQYVHRRLFSTVYSFIAELQQLVL